MTNDQRTDQKIQNQQPLPTLYQIGNRNVVFARQFLVYFQTDPEDFKNRYPNIGEIIPTRHYSQLEDDNNWISKNTPSATKDNFVITETGALFLSTHLNHDDIYEVNKLIDEIFSQTPIKPEPKIPESLFSNLNPLQQNIKVGEFDESAQYYHDVLDNALKHKLIRHIAFAAPYGAGKTTVIDSYFKNREEYSLKTISISLGTFEDGKKEEKISNEYERQKVEKNILQQLIYQSDPERLTESRILRIHEISSSARDYGILQLTVFFFAICLVYIDKIFPSLVDADLVFVSSTFKVIGICAITLIAPPFIFDIFKSARNIKISKFSTLAGDVELSHAKELSVFNQYLDELLYFFERTTFNIVIIEDLDRFGDVEIFSRLRSLNQTLNNYPKLKERNIIFIYAMRDDIFAKDHRDRTKFFDLIIPIVPIINSSNSKDKFKSLLTDAVIQEYDLDESFIDEVSEHIQDMRLLKNIVNEFFVYWRLLRRNVNYDGNELLAAIIYKNLEPGDFAAFHENKGKLWLLKTFKKCLYEYADGAGKDILINEKGEKLETYEASLKFLINDCDDFLRKGDEKNRHYFKEFYKSAGYSNEQQKWPLIDNYLKPGVFVTLLGCGYLRENIEAYISYLHYDGLNFEEQKYVNSINQRETPENTELTITRRILEKIHMSVFNHKVILQASLFNYVFSYDKYRVRQNLMLNVLIKQRKEAFNYLSRLIESDNFEKIILALVNKWANFWAHVPNSFLSTPQFQALIPILPSIENQKEVIQSIHEETLKLLINGKMIDLNQENADLIAKTAPNTLAYFLFNNQEKIKSIQINDEWVGNINEGHSDVSDDNLKSLEIMLWPNAKGYHDINKMVRKNRIKHHSFILHDVSTKLFPEVDSDILKSDKGFISIWAYVSDRIQQQFQWIISHSLDNGEESDQYESRYFYPSGWGISISPTLPNRINPIACKLTSYKKEIPEDINEKSYIGLGIEAVKPILNRWHLFTIAWYKDKNYIKFFIDTDEIQNKSDQFTFENNWPDKLSGRINFGRWENQKDIRHHLSGKIGPFIMVTEELTKDMLNTYFATKPQ